MEVQVPADVVTVEPSELAERWVLEWEAGHNELYGKPETTRGRNASQFHFSFPTNDATV